MNSPGWVVNIFQIPLKSFNLLSKFQPFFLVEFVLVCNNFNHVVTNDSYFMSKSLQYFLNFCLLLLNIHTHIESYETHHRSFFDYTNVFI